jgi:hypothetical protein
METQVVTVAYLCSIYCMQRGTQWQKGLFAWFHHADPPGHRYLRRDRTDQAAGARRPQRAN